MLDFNSTFFIGLIVRSEFGLVNVVMKWFIFWHVLRSADVFLGRVEYEIVFSYLQLFFFQFRPLEGLLLFCGCVHGTE